MKRTADEYMQIVYSGNQVELKKWNIIKVWDGLYCMTNDELNSRQALGSATVTDFVKHDKAEVLLNNIILDKGIGWFVNARVREVVEVLDGMISRA